MAFGAYPEVILADASKRRDEARQQRPVAGKAAGEGAATSRSHEHLGHPIRRGLRQAKERQPRRLIARRTLQLAGMVCRYAVTAAGLASYPVRDPRGAFATRPGKDGMRR